MAAKKQVHASMKKAGELITEKCANKEGEDKTTCRKKAYACVFPEGGSAKEVKCPPSWKEQVTE